MCILSFEQKKVHINKKMLGYILIAMFHEWMMLDNLTKNKKISKVIALSVLKYLGIFDVLVYKLFFYILE